MVDQTGFHGQLRLRRGRQALAVDRRQRNTRSSCTPTTTDGQLAREDNGNGTYTTYEYDADGNVCT